MSHNAVLAVGHHEIKPVPAYILKRSRVDREGFEELAAEVFPGAFELYRVIKEVCMFMQLFFGCVIACPCICDVL
jgi:hypothetical protein